MARCFSIGIEKGLNESIGNLVAGMLEKDAVQAVMVPSRIPAGNMVKQVIISDKSGTDSVDPFAPVVPVNSATLLAKMTRTKTGRKTAAFLRPCEVRAFIELVKLKQASLENVILIGMDCLGRFGNREYSEKFASGDQTGHDFLKKMTAGGWDSSTGGYDLVTACKACVHPVAEKVDLRLQVLGHDIEKEIAIEAVTDEGEKLAEGIGLKETDEASGRAGAVDDLLSERKKFRQSLHEEYHSRAGDIKGLTQVISNCINCYNCRVVCPVCYCRECVFVTDTFSHESRMYFNWAEKHGQLTMPADTLFYHLTRMAHMSTLCVGCGQCTTACPNGVPVYELFSVVAENTQAVFDYSPGRDPDEEQPLATFVEDEFQSLTD